MTETPPRERPKRGMIEDPIRDPWTAPILLAQIPSSGLHKVIEPTAAQAMSLAQTAGILDVENIRAELTLMPMRGDRIKVEGRVTGRVGQTCVVTLERIENPVDETVELIFAPVEQVNALAASMEDSDEDAAQRPDPPEPIENGMIDLGRIASDALFLGLDPYPRKPDAVFQPPAVEDDPEDHPFAALKVLKPDA